MTGDFVLKGGLLLGAYGVRRPTRDVDSNVVSADVTAEHLHRVVDDVASSTRTTASSSSWMSSRCRRSGTWRNTPV